jgi:hypothetical protein
MDEREYCSHCGRRVAAIDPHPAKLGETNVDAWLGVCPFCGGPAWTWYGCSWPECDGRGHVVVDLINEKRLYCVGHAKRMVAIARAAEDW